MHKLPPLDPNTNENAAPHVFLLGAGASRASFPKGDLHGKPLPLMNDITQMTGLYEVLAKAGVKFDGRDFEALYDKLASDSKNLSLVEAMESVVYDYFSALELPPTPTLYDYLVLFLRPKDVIATFNWDPLLVLAYIRNSHLVELPHLIFLHGNVAIGTCTDDMVKGYPGEPCKLCGQQYSPSKLLYPVRDKSYTSDEFISSEWEAFKHFLARAYLLTIFGYSAPKTDIAAREAMLGFWETNGYKELAQIEIIDVRCEEELHNEWREFITRDHYAVFRDLKETYLFRYPRRSCDAFSSASLMLKPWPIHRPPEFGSLSDLHRWVEPLISEEKAVRREGIAHNPRLISAPGNGSS